MKWKDFLDGRARAIIQRKRDAGLRLHLPPFEFQPQFQEEELFEDQAKCAGVRADCKSEKLSPASGQ